MDEKKLSPEYEKAFAECIRDIVAIMNKSPEHGNAMIDILGEARYHLTLSVNNMLDTKDLIEELINR